MLEINELIKALDVCGTRVKGCNGCPYNSRLRANTYKCFDLIKVEAAIRLQTAYKEGKLDDKG